MKFLSFLLILVNCACVSKHAHKTILKLVQKDAENQCNTKINELNEKIKVGTTIIVRDTIIVVQIAKSHIDTQIVVDTLYHTIFKDRLKIIYQIRKDSIYINGNCDSANVSAKVAITEKTIIKPKFEPFVLNSNWQEVECWYCDLWYLLLALLILAALWLIVRKYLTRSHHL